MGGRGIEAASFAKSSELLETPDTCHSPFELKLFVASAPAPGGLVSLFFRDRLGIACQKSHRVERICASRSGRSTKVQCNYY